MLRFQRVAAGPFEWSRPPKLFPGRTEWIDQIACFVLGRPHHNPFLHIVELSKVVVGEALPLRHNHARLGPLAVLSEANGAHDCLERMAADEICDLAVIEALSGLHSLSEHLTGRISIGREIIAKGIDALTLCPLPIFGQ